MTRARANGRSPTAALLLGLIITLATVVAYSWYISGQISGLAAAADRAHRSQPARLAAAAAHPERSEPARAGDARHAGRRRAAIRSIAWSAQFERIRARPGRRAEARGRGRRSRRRTPEQRAVPGQLAWRSSGTPPTASSRWRATGQDDEARAQIRLSLQARQAALSTAVARLLVQNNEAEEQTAQQVQEIYRQRAAAGLLVPGRDAGRDRRDQPVPDPLEPAAVRAARGALRRAARAGADS